MAKHYGYFDNWKEAPHRCSHCDWRGSGAALQHGEATWDLFELCCPACGELIAIVSNPTTEEARANWDKLDESRRRHVEDVEASLARFEREKLKDPSQLPDIPDDALILTWDFQGPEGPDSRTLLKHGDVVIFSEPAVYEGYGRFEQVAALLVRKYGNRLKDLLPTERSELYLYGDSLSAPAAVERVRGKLFRPDREQVSRDGTVNASGDLR